MRKITTTLVSILFGGILLAQSNNDSIPERPVNGIVINLLGDASMISVNYERLLLIRETFFIAGDLGLGYNEEFELNIFGSYSAPDKYLTIPHRITGNVGRGQHFFEFGLGGTVITGNTNQNYLFYPILGYRLQPIKSNRFNFRVFGEFPFPRVKDIVFTPFGLSLGLYF